MDDNRPITYINNVFGSSEPLDDRPITYTNNVFVYDVGDTISLTDPRGVTSQYSIKHAYIQEYYMIQSPNTGALLYVTRDEKTQKYVIDNDVNHTYKIDIRGKYLRKKISERRRKETDAREVPLEHARFTLIKYEMWNHELEIIYLNLVDMDNLPPQEGHDLQGQDHLDNLDCREFEGYQSLPITRAKSPGRKGAAGQKQEQGRPIAKTPRAARKPRVPKNQQMQAPTQIQHPQTQLMPQTQVQQQWNPVVQQSWNPMGPIVPQNFVGTSLGHQAQGMQAFQGMQQMQTPVQQAYNF